MSEESRESYIVGQLRALVDKIPEEIAYLRETRELVQKMAIKVDALEEACKFQEEENSCLRAQLQEAEICRKKMQNKILELKGNIRVFCRVRPSDGAEAANIVYPTGAEFADQAIVLMQNEHRHLYTLDKVFPPSASQQDVFVEISELVQSALDGKKVSIFAYGQTGSGKTYTMMGVPGGDGKGLGLIPRSFQQVFKTSEVLASQGWKLELKVSMMEIYKETIHDLLSSAGVGNSLDIKHDAGNAYVQDLTIFKVSSYLDIMRCLIEAMSRRSVGRTDMNECSSRSHFICTLRICAVHESTPQEFQGVLNFVDLAGSERLSKSGVRGDQEEESKAINKSLSALDGVISAVRNKNAHIPFRDSKLTHVLQPCLNGDSKILMFVNLSLDLSSVGESLCSLRFAAKANTCQITRPRG